jgi:hypothetical protein
MEGWSCFCRWECGVGWARVTRAERGYLSIERVGWGDRGRFRETIAFAMRLAFVHQIPVRAQLVDLPERYPYSSAYRAAAGEPYLSG